MTNPTIPVTIRIFGKEYTVACPAGEEDGLRKSAVRVDEEMRKIREGNKVMSTDRIAIMVALNLAHELLLSQQIVPGDAMDAHSQKRLQTIQQDIESVLERYKNSAQG